MEDPYDVLGISKNSTFASVRQRYIELAKLHHPDKLQNISKEERDEHEKYFKRVTAAYHMIAEMQKKDNSTPDACTPPSYEYDIENWREIWNNVESFIKAGMKRVQKQKIHRFRLPITMQDIYLDRVKKVELILRSSHDAPVYLRVPCKEYPFFRIFQDNVEYECNMELQEHSMYELDANMNICTTIYITPGEYVFGTKSEIPFITDSEKVEIDIPAFCGMDYRVEIKDKGLFPQTSLLVTVKLALPSKMRWDSMAEAEKRDIQNSLNQINALYEISSGVETTKSI